MNRYAEVCIKKVRLNLVSSLLYDAMKSAENIWVSGVVRILLSHKINHQYP